jgi:hypothetical protein
MTYMRNITNEGTKVGREVIQIPVFVTLGQPSKDCENYGVCSVEYVKELDIKDLEEERSRCNSTKAILSYSPQLGLEIAFLKSSMTECCINRFFKDAFFKVLEAYTFLDDITKELRCEQLDIPAGNYPIRSNLGFYTVAFNKESDS